MKLSGRIAKSSATRAIVLGIALRAMPLHALTLTRGPYLTMLTTRSVTIVWNTDIGAGCSLRIGRTGQAPVVIAGAGSTTVCAIAVQGLVPGESYTYVPLANGVTLGTPSTFVADDPDAPFTFGVVGDTASSSGKNAVRDRMIAGGLDLVVSTGDMVYEDGSLSDQNGEFFKPYKDIVRQMVFWPVMGNHDYETSRGAPWVQVHYTPANNAAHSEQYYSFDHGNAHFAVIDSDQSTSKGSPQYVFLAQDLAASTAQWKFVFFHHAIYVSAGANSTIRSNLAPLFDATDVDVVFMGHVHLYERSKPLRAGKVVSAAVGTVYVTTGGGGASLHGSASSSTTAYAESTYHYTRVAVDGGALKLEMIRSDGKVRDTMTLVKGPRAITTTTTTIPTTTTTSTTTSTSTTTTTLPPGARAVDVPVAASADDAEESSSGSVSLASSALEMTGSTPQTIGLRFRKVAIPHGAHVLRAWVQFVVDKTSSGAAPLALAGENVDNSAAFSDSSKNISRRTRTPGVVAWDPPSWTSAGAAGNAQRTPDLTAVVQEIVDRPAWVAGNALSIFVTGTGRRVAMSYDGDKREAPLLHVDYLDPVGTGSGGVGGTTTTPTATTTTTIPGLTGTLDVRVAASTDDAEEAGSGGVSLTSSDLELTNDSSDQTVGIRFAKVAIPQGAVIKRAWVQFKVDETSTDKTTLSIAAQAADNAATFTTSSKNVSSRGRTSAVAWAPVSWTSLKAASTAQRTPDLSAIIQQVVARPGWTNGNALVLVVTGKGRRVAVAYDGDRAGAPLLHVEY